MQSEAGQRIGRWMGKGLGMATAIGLLLGAGLPSARAESLYMDIKSSQVGDLLTIVVVELTQASRSASTQTRKQGSVGFRMDSSGTVTSNGAILSADHMGDGVTKSSGALRTTVTAMITEVLPNGHLKVEGTRQLTINNEKEILRVRGVCRTVDITANNTIRSNQLANATIEYTGEGWIAKQQKPNILLRILVGILPFI